MAAKKTTGKATTGKAVAKWDEQLAKMAALSAKMEENSLGLGNAIGTQGGVMKYRDNEVPGNKLNCIVLDFTLLNAYYTEGFDPDNPASPACFAIAKDEKDLKPHETSEDKQNNVCKGCPQNEWASDDRGRGKACKNGRRLVLITEDGLDDIENAQIATIKVPVTSVKGWAGYVKNIAEVIKRPPFGVVTEISLVPDKKRQFEMHFEMVRERVIDGDLIGALIERSMAKSTQDILLAPFPKFEEQERQAKPSKAAKNRKPAGKARR